MKPATVVWVHKAGQDFGTAQRELAAAANFDAVLFHAQQSVEKLMKAVLTEHGVAFPRTHSLVELAKLIAHVSALPTLDPSDLLELQPGAVEFRYPGAEAVADDAQCAMKACTRLRHAILPLLQL